MLHAGLDLSRRKVDVCLLNDHGQQLDQFLDTRIREQPPRGGIEYTEQRAWPTGMVILSMTLGVGGGPTTYRAARDEFRDALDDDEDLPPPVAFDSWWEDAVLVSNDGTEWSRRRFILGAANQEGGGHVDPKPAASWRGLRDGTWIGAVKIHGPAGAGPVSDLAPAVIRQITYELLVTLEAAGHA
jgi:hypothetical protein